MQMLRPVFRVLLDGDVERRFVAVGFGNRLRGVRAIGLGPALEQPVGRVARSLVGQERGAILRDTAQHGVDQAGIARGAAVGLRQTHRQVDRGMVGHIEPEDLRGADQQNGFGARRVGRHALGHQLAEQMPQRAEPAQNRGDQAAHQRAIAVGQRGEAGVSGAAGQLLVERNLLAQHAVDDVGGDPAGGKAGDFGLGGGARTGHAPSLPRIVSRSRARRKKHCPATALAGEGRLRGGSQGQPIQLGVA